ncbi:importin subunit alpha-2 [Pyrus ussuriensis x Pyrus communis]|uniref:Importin subunit alpha-2 n=1 Tax=Pyrus ussuriensis x Pyrus communis TaxID=2448454 RepID=A0A5N5H7V1_9ROSA|nr:importin subunit alpha-2 [Pyrus ussuriensis x Pyrus communis]
MLSAKLDIHSRNLSEVYNADVFTRQFSIVVSRPVNRACIDDMRLFAKIVVLIGVGIIVLLIRVLKCRSEVGKEEAAKSLQRLKSENKNKIIIL